MQPFVKISQNFYHRYNSLMSTSTPNLKFKMYYIIIKTIKNATWLIYALLTRQHVRISSKNQISQVATFFTRQMLANPKHSFSIITRYVLLHCFSNIKWFPMCHARSTRLVKLQPMSNDTTFLKTSGQTTRRARLVNIRSIPVQWCSIHSLWNW